MKIPRHAWRSLSGWLAITVLLLGGYAYTSGRDIFGWLAFCVAVVAASSFRKSIRRDT